MSDRFPPRCPTAAKACVIACPNPTVPWFEITLTLAMFLLLHVI